MYIIISLFVHFKYTVKIYNHNLLKISINNHALLCIHIHNYSLPYIHINTHNNYHNKVYIETPKIFYHDTHKILKKHFFSCIYKNGWRKYYVLWKRWQIIHSGRSYITSNRYLEYIDSYNYYDIDGDKILLFNILSTPKIQIKKK